jgi:uncharacterized protein YggE
MRTIAVLAAILLVPGVAAAQQNNQQPPVIVTRGEAILKRAPDQAWVSIAAESRAATAAQAQQANADAMRAVQAALAKSGLPADAVKTTGYSLQPDMEYSGGRSRVRGYIARNSIEVRVDDLQKLSTVIDAAGQSGATNMSGLRFDLKDRANVEREALRLAVQDAMARARAIAAGANAQIGAIVRIDEQGGFEPPPMPMYRTQTLAVEAAPQTPITPGEVEIRAQVTLTVAVR